MPALESSGDESIPGAGSTAEEKMPDNESSDDESMTDRELSVDESISVSESSDEATDSSEESTRSIEAKESRKSKGIGVRNRQENRVKSRTRQVQRLQEEHPGYEKLILPQMDRSDVVRLLKEAEVRVTEARSRLEGLINQQKRLAPGLLADAVDEQVWARRERNSLLQEFGLCQLGRPEVHL